LQDCAPSTRQELPVTASLAGWRALSAIISV
jgi:hypothetical protein